MICVSVCTFVFFAKLLFHFTCNYPLICVYVCNYPSKQFQSMPTEFEVKVSQGAQTASYDSNQKPLPPIQPCVFFFEKVQLPLIHVRRHTLIRHTPFPLPLPIHTVCVSVTQSHPNLFEWTVRMDQTMGHFCVGCIKMFPQIKRTIFTVHPVPK